ncbi:MAG TPA: rhomboid family intramembrane serine protease [Candidatus Krumholzibacteria bacterium]|nr:rhomboid family intramembrane serine protease [Candidatus Krumholzibacteria bacterium]
MSPPLRQMSPFSGPPFLGTAVGRIIVITVGVFFLQNVFPPINQYLALTPRLAIEHFQVWQFVTYIFLHGSFWHLFFNLLVLWFIGTMVEAAWGPARFMRYYLVCGIGGGLLHSLLQYNASVIGASGAIFGVYFAVAMLFPDQYLYLYFLIPVKVKYFVIGLTILQLANGIAGPSGIAYFAHLGGMLAGALMFQGEILRRMRFQAGPRRRWQAHIREVRRQDEEASRNNNVNNINSILDKISAKGYQTLTPTEKKILENYSRQRRDSSE